MMFGVNLFVLLILYISHVVCEVKPIYLPCKLRDLACTTHLTQWLYDDAVAGKPEKGIENLDPMKLDVIIGIQEHVNYTLKDCSIEGYKDCSVLSASFTLDMSRMHIDLLCPRFHMTGSYDIVGSLNNYPIHGKGPFYFITTNYNLSLDTDVSFYKRGSNLHAKLKSFTVVADMTGTADFELKNLFDGNKELSDPIHAFGKQNPKEFVTFLDKPIFKVTFEKVLKNLNSVLQERPIKELLQVSENLLKIEQ